MGLVNKILIMLHLAKSLLSWTLNFQVGTSNSLLTIRFTNQWKWNVRSGCRISMMPGSGSGWKPKCSRNSVWAPQESCSSSRNYRQFITFLISGGYIQFTVNNEVYEPMKVKCEERMQELHDAGKWKWLETKKLEKYSLSIQSNKYTTGIKFLFQKI